MRKDFLTTKYYYKTKPDGSKRPPPTMYTSHASSSILIPLDFIAINISAVYTPPYGDNGSVLSYNYSKYYLYSKSAKALDYLRSCLTWFSFSSHDC